MLSRRLVGTVLALLAASTAAARDAWWLEDWPLRQIVEVTTPDPSGTINTASAVIDTEGRCAQGREDIRVVDAANGSPVKHRAVSIHDGVAQLEFLAPPASAGGFRYHVYYGNPKAQKEDHAWDRKVGGLTLATYLNTRKQNAQSWQHMQELVRESTWKFGEGARKQIFDVDNPFGPDEQYLGVYKGKIYCRQDGEYLFATNSDDSSFLLIDGRLVAQWPGGHDPLNDFDTKNGLAGSLALKKGIHTIEYYHVETVGAQLAKAGWRPPWSKVIKTIPEEVFIRELRTTVLARESRVGAMDAFFSWAVREEHQFTTMKESFVTLAFQSHASSRFGEVALWRWDFGDGASSSEASPRHQFLREGVFEVRLSCVDTLGYRDTCARRVVVKAADPTRIEPMLEVLAEEPVLRPGQPVRLSLKARCTGVETWPCRLVAEVKTQAGQTLERGVTPLVLGHDKWWKTEKDLKADTPSGRIAFTLTYRDVPLLARGVHVVPVENPPSGLRVENKGLVNEQGERVLLRLSADVAVPPSPGFLDRLRARRRVTVALVDDSLSSGAEEDKGAYHSILRERLAEKYPGRKITVRRVGADFMSHHDPLARLAEAPERAADLAPDLVIVAGSLRDLMQHVPAASYETYLYALVDRLRGATQAEVLLITPPPMIVNPGLSKQYAERTERVALRRGLKVVDAYSAFSRRGEEEAWRRFFQDPDDPDVYYMQPNREGQRLIAERVLNELLDS